MLYQKGCDVYAPTSFLVLAEGEDGKGSLDQTIKGFKRHAKDLEYHLVVGNQLS